MTADWRLCFVGDSFVQGTADDACLGWVGRAAATARNAGHDVTCYNLGIRRDTSADIRRRWQSECTRRFRDGCRNAIVFSFGANDMTMENGRLRVPLEDSLENLSAILTEARAVAPVLMIGPLPVNDRSQDERLAVLCEHYTATSAQLGVPYLPLLQTMTDDTRWQQAVAKGDGTHPDGDGYARVAERVMQWPAWWFSTTPL